MALWLCRTHTAPSLSKRGPVPLRLPGDIVAGPPPQPVISDGRARLLYELRLTNVAPIPIEVVARCYTRSEAVPLGDVIKFSMIGLADSISFSLIVWGIPG